MKQKNILVSVLSIMFSFILLVAPSIVPVMAQVPTSGGGAADKGLSDIADAFPEGARREKSVPEITKLIINWALYLAAIIAVIFIIIGGYFYITSAGNAGQATKGRDTLVNALIGLALIILSYIIVQIVYNFLTNKPN